LGSRYEPRGNEGAEKTITLSAKWGVEAEGAGKKIYLQLKINRTGER